MAAEQMNPQRVMASRWRRRRLCLLIGDHPAPAAIRHISGRSAFLETNQRPAIGATIAIRHPEAGAIQGLVRAHDLDGILIALPGDTNSTAFALAAIAADMSQPA